jgi:hypothetical protein
MGQSTCKSASLPVGPTLAAALTFVHRGIEALARGG